MSVLVIASRDLTNYKKLVNASLQLGDDLHACLLGGSPELAKQIASVQGVTKVLHINPNTNIDTAEQQADIICQLADSYQQIVSIADTYGKNCMPRVAALCDRTMVSDVIQINGSEVFLRPIYAGNVIAEVSTEGKSCLTIRVAAFGSALATTVPIEVETINLSISDKAKKTRVIDQKLSASDRPDLTSAKVIVSGGRGLASKENFEQILTPLADQLNAAIGASRAAVDLDYVDNDSQVGQTGKIVAPDLYLAIGISGAIQHLAGIQNSKVIVAINKDEEAPIFEVADYGLVGDLFELVPELCDRLSI